MADLFTKFKKSNFWQKSRKKTPFKQLLKIRDKCRNYYTLKIKFPNIYKQAAKEPVQDNKVIFLECSYSNITDSLLTLYRAVKESGKYEIHEHYMDQIKVSTLEYYGYCETFVRDMATAKYVILDEGCNVIGCLPKRSETTIVNLWHGCGAFKRFGMSTANLIFGGSRRSKLTYPGYDNFDLVTVSSPEAIWAYEEAMNYKGREDRRGVIQPLGVSRTDVFFDERANTMAHTRLYQVFPESRGKKIILYAPTFRGRIKHAKAPDKLDIPLWKKALSEDYVLLIKHHPLLASQKKRPNVPQNCRDFAMDVTGKMTIEELLFVSDICVSDYSSLVFEYSLFERPMAFFSYDLENYKEWRGFYYDYSELTPGPICTTNEELIDYIQNIDTRFDRKIVADFKEKFMRSCDGHATERIWNAVFKEPMPKNLCKGERPMNIAVIIAGSAHQTDRDILKQFIYVNDKPVIIHTLESFDRHPMIDEIEVVCPDGWHDVLWAYAKQFNIAKLKWVISGGETEQESIRDGIFNLEGKCEPQDIVIINDGLRPLVDDTVLTDIIEKCGLYGNAVTSMPYNEQIFVIADENSTVRYIPRETLRQVTPPQAYRFDLIDNGYHEAFEKGIGIHGTSYADTMMAELGHRLYFASGSEKNIKLSTKDELEMFKTYTKQSPDK